MWPIALNIWICVIYKNCTYIDGLLSTVLKVECSDITSIIFNFFNPLLIHFSFSLILTDPPAKGQRDCKRNFKGLYENV